jgi:signal transduction histidine kinase
MLFAKNMYHDLIDGEKQRLEYRLNQEFAYLEALFNLFEKQVHVKYRDKIITLGNSLVNTYPYPQAVPIDTLKRIAYNLSVDQVFLINRTGIIVNTTYQPELDNNIKTESDNFNRFFDNLFISHDINTLSLGINSYSKAIEMYAFYVPKNSNYAIETSINLIDFLRREYPEILESGLFLRMNKLIPNEREIIDAIDIFTFDDKTKTSIFNTGNDLPLNQIQINTLLKTGVYTIHTKKGEDEYRMISIKSTFYTFPARLVMFTSYNYNTYKAYYSRLIFFNLLVLVIILIIISYLSPIIAHRLFLKKIAIINHNLISIKISRYNDLKSFSGNDELSEISANINELHHSVIQREAQLKEAKMQAEVADKLKSAFLANMSHEIRTPLNAVVGFAQLLRDANPSPEDVERYVGLINTNSNRLLQLISDIIDLSQIESGQLKIIPRPLCLDELFNELYASANSIIVSQNQVFTRKDIVICIEKEEFPKGEYIITDPYRLKQIMEQLIDNAIKFTCVGEIRMGYKLIESDIEFFVSDTGVGIAKDNQDKIFERFVQAEEYLTREFGGTGLGLAICRELVQLLGGNIQVESEIHKGSTFKFKLPYRRSVKN